MGKEERKMVRFTNARISYGRPRPWRVSSYRDQYGRIVDFKQIGLYKENGEPDMIPDGNGGQTQRTWGKILNFSSNQRVLELDPVIHKDVIQAIRDYPKCRSSSKSEGLPWVELGRVFEEEPELAEQQQLEAAMLENEAQKAFLQVSHLEENMDPFVFDMICAANGIMNGSQQSKWLRLKTVVENNPQNFIDTLEDGEIVVRQDLYGPTLIKLANSNNVLAHKNGIYYLEDVNLGSRLGKIHSEYQNHLGAIKDALDEKLEYGARMKEKSSSKTTAKKSSTSSRSKTKAKASESDGGTTKVGARK